MVETISPKVFGSRSRTYWSSLILHVLGAATSAAAFGAVLGGVGSVLGAPWGHVEPLLLIGLALAYFARDAFGLRVPIPDRHKQVPEWWRTFYSPPVAAFLYGLGLGVGFLTFLTFGTYVVVAAGAVVSGSAIAGATIAGTFGLARSVAVAGVAKTSIDELEKLAASWGPRFVNVVAITLVAAVAAASV